MPTTEHGLDASRILNKLERLFPLGLLRPPRPVGAVEIVEVAADRAQRAHRTRARAPVHDHVDPLSGGLLVLDLLLLHGDEALVGAVHRDDAEAGEIMLEKVAQQRQHRLVGPVRARVVVDDELVVCRVVGRGLGRWTPGNVFRGMRVLRGLGVRRSRWSVEATDEEFARAGNVGRDIAVHCVLAQHVDTEFAACLGEAEHAVEGQHICEDATALVKVSEAEELLRGFLRAGGKGASLGRRTKVVDTAVLFVERLVEDAATEAFACEHESDRGAKLNVAVVQLRGDGA
ncbi:hypothetical protein HYQ46_011317 [Verticillium longisporum]|nr:hypothetical protein HYQ46_011317 [Verticillium longisporum]